MNGGILGGKTDESGNKFVLLLGTVTQPPQEKTTRTGSTFIKFSVGYGDKKYMNCTAWGNNEDVAPVVRCLEKRDNVLLIGKWSSSEYTNQQGAQKRYESLEVSLALPLSAIVGMLTQMGGGDGEYSDFADISEDETGLPF